MWHKCYNIDSLELKILTLLTSYWNYCHEITSHTNLEKAKHIIKFKKNISVIQTKSVIQYHLFIGTVRLTVRLVFCIRLCLENVVLGLRPNRLQGGPS